MKKWLIMIIVFTSIMLSGCMSLMFLNNETDINSKDNSEIETNDMETKNELKTNEYTNEQEYKSNCIEIIYNDLDKSWIDKNVTKELLFNDSEKSEFSCGATEDFIEEYKHYQHTYRVYDIIDKRLDKTFPIQSNDVIRIYGKVVDIKKNYANGLYLPVIEIYYIDYIRKWGKTIEEEKTIDDIIKEREEEKRKEEEKDKYYDSLNSDYTGVTKNIEDMSSLGLSEYKLYCDKLNYNDLYSGEDFTGRHVSIHVQLFKKMAFKNEKSKINVVGSWVDAEYIQDIVWEMELYNERAEAYVADFGTLYFLNKENIIPSCLEKKQNLIIYGEIVSQPKAYYEDWEIIVRYYEIN